MAAGEGRISVVVTGRPAGVQAFRGVLRRAAEEATRSVAEALLADSRAYVPVLTGALLDSGRIESVDGGADFVRAQVVYGDDATSAYAVRQHDEPFNHPSLGFYGKALYLRRPFDRFGPFYVALFQQRMTQAILEMT